MSSQEFSMPPFALWKWLFLSKEHLPSEDRWVTFSCNGVNREKQFGLSPVATDLVLINGKTVKFCKHYGLGVIILFREGRRPYVIMH